MNGFSNTLRTWTLMAALGGLLVAVGGLIGGQSGLVMAFVFAIALNGFVYWKSDSLALRANGARELRPDEQPRLRSIIALPRRPCRHPDAACLPRRAAGAQRVRDRPRPEARSDRRDDRPARGHGRARSSSASSRTSSAT